MDTKKTSVGALKKLSMESRGEDGIASELLKKGVRRLSGEMVG